ncbi:MAG: Hint domain-containing protein [Pseudomonadota bacterium]
MPPKMTWPADATGEAERAVHEKILQDGAETAQSSIGLMEGASVLTLKGALRVETLRMGDRVITRAGAQYVTRITTLSAVLPAVYVIAGSLSHYRTDRDCMLPACQTILIRDWRARALTGRSEALLRAQSLVDGEFVRAIEPRPMTLHRLFLGTAQVLYSDGMELGSAEARPVAMLSETEPVKRAV